MGDKLILVGRFGTPHGITGELRLSSFTADPAAIATYKPLLDETGSREFCVLALRPATGGGDMFVVRIAGISDRTRAGALTNAGLYVPRASLPEVGEEEYYLADLIGLAVMTEDREEFGRVVNILNFGGGDILEISPRAGGSTVLLPFNRQVFPSVDLEAGRLTVVPPVELEAQLPVPER